MIPPSDRHSPEGDARPRVAEPAPAPIACDFESWRADFRRALASGGTVEVPCGSCTACCRSRQFVLIEADEVATLRRIDAALLVPAPGRRDGARVLGYDRQGRCPMLGAGGCGIYADRPRACRSYDCRVFAAAGVRPGQPLIALRVREWRFDDSPARRAAVGLARRMVGRGEDPRRAALQAIEAAPR